MTPEQENQKLLSDAHSAKLATWESIQQGALKHYEELATKAHTWLSTIPNAIEAYKDPSAPDPFIEWLDEQISLSKNSVDEQDEDPVIFACCRSFVNAFQKVREKYIQLTDNK